MTYREWYVKHFFLPRRHPVRLLLTGLSLSLALLVASVTKERDEVILEYEAKLEHYRATRDVLINCMNGARGFYYKDTGATFECSIKEI